MLAKHSVQMGNVENIAYFTMSIFFNALGNALTVSLNLGSALWTASAVNFTQMTGVPLDLVLFVYGLIVILINVLTIGRFDWRRVLGNLVFLGPFSYLIGMFSVFLNGLGIDALPLTVRIILDVAGICLISLAVSIYQRVNWLLHPCDDLMQIVRFKYLRGSAPAAQLVTFVPPILVIIVCWITTYHLFAVNVGTIFSLLFQGPLVGIFDKCIFPSLKHRHIEHNHHRHGLSY